MHFLPDIYVPCDVCGGKKYNKETLKVKFKDKNIYEVLEKTVEEGLKFFENIPNIYRRLQTLYDVGLGYIKIGQASTTLSGGEAQRVKLATELSKRSTGKTVYILDEPTTGLHTADVHKLIEVLHKLVEGGNSVIVIEHNLDAVSYTHLPVQNITLYSLYYKFIQESTLIRAKYLICDIFPDKKQENIKCPKKFIKIRSNIVAKPVKM